MFLTAADRWSRRYVIGSVARVLAILIAAVVAVSELECGRSLLAHERSTAALRKFGEVKTSHASSPAAAEPPAQSHRAGLDAALALAAAENPARDLTAAIADLQALEREAFDGWIGVAGVARASMLVVAGKAEEAERVMHATLARWASFSAAAPDMPPPAPGSIEHDVIAIRDAVFLPMGGGIYGSSRRDTFEWPVEPPLFAIAAATMRVSVTGQPDPLLISVARRPTGAPDVVFMSGEERDALHRLPLQLGGSRRREPRAVMEVPNQPVGDASAIVRFWGRFFFVRPGHWGGWLTDTPPSFGAIQFTNDDRTRAAVLVRFVYTGATVILEKVNGAWVAKELTGMWIE